MTLRRSFMPGPLQGQLRASRFALRASRFALRASHFALRRGMKRVCFLFFFTKKNENSRFAQRALHVSYPAQARSSLRCLLAQQNTKRDSSENLEPLECTFLIQHPPNLGASSLLPCCTDLVRKLLK